LFVRPERVIWLFPDTAVVVGLEHGQLQWSVPLSVAVNVNVGVLLEVFVIVHVVIIGAVAFQKKSIIHVVVLVA